MSLKSVLHVNSYFVTSKLHAKLLNAFSDVSEVRHSVYVPVQQRDQLNIYRDLVRSDATIVYSHCFGGIDRWLWPLKMAKLHRDFANRFKDEKFDVIHAHSLTVNGLLAYFHFKRHSIPYVVTVRNTDVNTFLQKSVAFRKLLKPVLEHAQAVIFLTPAYWRSFFPVFYDCDFLSTLERKLFFVPNGIDDFWLEDSQSVASDHHDELRILFSGRVVENKNLHGVLKACEILSSKGIRCSVTVVGDGPAKEGLLSFAWPFKITDHGYISSQVALLDIYRSADVLAVPSFKESFGLVYAEALSQGLGIIYSRNQGFDGQFEQGEVGYAVNPVSPEDIAEKLILVREGLDQIKSRALEAGKRYSWQKTARDYLAAYGKV